MRAPAKYSGALAMASMQSAACALTSIRAIPARKCGAVPVDCEIAKAKRSARARAPAISPSGGTAISSVNCSIATAFISGIGRILASTRFSPPRVVAPTTVRNQRPYLSADLFGDWREEVIFRTADNNALRIYTTTIPTEHRITTLMHDPQYRLSIATQNVGYNQPPHPSFLSRRRHETPPHANITVLTKNLQLKSQASQRSRHAQNCRSCDAKISPACFFCSLSLLIGCQDEDNAARISFIHLPNPCERASSRLSISSTAHADRRHRLA
jgi:hypothetical protein